MDAVFTWVDGSDAKFIAEKRRFEDYEPPAVPQKWRERSEYTGAQDLARAGGSPSRSDNRFRDMQELRYALRSLEANAPWFRRIHIVTNGQVPTWLNRNHPKVRIVSHEQIFPDPDCLPCFNSNAIELNLHRIPDLSEDFVYFNDDFFLGRPVRPEDFRDSDGLARLFVEAHRPLPVLMEDRAMMGHIWAYNHALLIERFGRANRQQFAHTPQMYNQRVLARMIEAWPEECRRTLYHRFRTPFDVAFRVLYTYFATSAAASEGGAVGRIVGIEDGLDYVFAKLGDDRTPYTEDVAAIIRQKPMFFCVNDEIDTGLRRLDKRLRLVMSDFLERVFPAPSGFEVDENTPHRKLSFKPVDRVRLGDLDLKLTGIDPGFGCGAKEPPLDVARDLKWSAPGSAWKDWPEGGAMLNRNYTMRLHGAASKGRVLLRLEAFAYSETEYPERGFPANRHYRVLARTGNDGNFRASDIIESCADADAYEAELSVYLKPILKRNSGDGMALFLDVDRRLRAGKAERRDHQILERAIARDFDPFWARHRQVLVAMQTGKLNRIAGLVASALGSQPDEWRVLYDLAGSLGALGRYHQALAILDGFHDDPVLWKHTVARQGRFLAASGAEVSDLDHVLHLACSDRPGYVRLWYEMGRAMDVKPWHALWRMEQNPPEGADAAETARIKYLLLAKSDRKLDAAEELKRFSELADDPQDLLDVIRVERSWGRNKSADDIMQVLIRRFPDFEKARLDWAEWQIAAKLAPMALIQGLSGICSLDPELRYRRSRLLIQAHLLRNDAAAALDELEMVISDPDKICDLMEIAKESISCQSLADVNCGGRLIMKAIRARYPDHPSVLLAWALDRIWLGDSSDLVLDALDRADREDGDPTVVVARANALLMRGDADGLTRLIRQHGGKPWASARFHALAEACESASMRHRIMDLLRLVGNSSLEMTLAWLDSCIEVGRTDPETVDAVALAKRQGVSEYLLGLYRFRLAVTARDFEAATGILLAALAEAPVMGPFEMALNKVPALGEAERHAMLKAGAEKILAATGAR